MEHREKMILTCPSCTAKYMVPDTAIGAEGRQVRCAKCKHDWFQAPLAAEAGIEEAAPASAAAPSQPDFAKALNEANSTAAEPSFAQSPAMGADSVQAGTGASNLPSVSTRPRRKKARMIWMGATIGLLAACGYLLGWEKQAVAEKSPLMAGIYGSLEIPALGLPVLVTCQDVGFINERVTAVEVREQLQRMIRVEGVLRNDGERNCLVPDIAISIKDTDGGVVKTWTVEPEVREIEPGAEMTFAGTTSAPDDPAADVVLEFIPRLR